MSGFNKIALYLLIIISHYKFCLFAQKSHVEIGIDEKLGNFLPLDAKFVTSEGDTVTLGKVLNKPTLLALVYYQCPGICSPLQANLAEAVDKIEMVPGKEFKVISLSFDHHENPKISSKWKPNYLHIIKRQFADSDWIFLTGDSISIKKVTDAAGFYFKPNEKNFVHAGTVIAISPKGKICRYSYGIDFNPFDLKMALIEAGAGQTNPTIAKVLQFCFSYDPAGRRYSLNATRIAGSIMLIAVGIFVGILTIKKRKLKKEEKEL
ncbi:SCO family protein [Melioribacteraceae bacterium 4301-Me]|uniref:SCO family protein n=1 Tax=Pyranulibacter aquaticus TaxID=3163344 RepID=UPI0035970DCF